MSNTAYIKVTVFSSLLPLNIINFTAVPKGATVLLNWSTANEMSAGSFIIESSRNGSSYYAIGKLPSMGKTLSMQNNYSYQYTGLSAGVNNFRIKLTDINGFVKYSEQVKVKIKDNGVITVFPNPASQFVTLRFDNGWLNKPATIHLLTATGELLLQKKIASLQVTEATDVSQLLSGNYIIQIIADGIIINKAIKVQHN